MRKQLSVLLLAAVLAFAAAGCGEGDEGNPQRAQGGQRSGGLSAQLLGAGATFPEPIYLAWIDAFKRVQPGVTINYQGIGSGGGVEQFIGQRTDFGASDAFMTDKEIQDAETACKCTTYHIPTVFGGVAIAYNVQGLDSLTLDGQTIADIFLGKIKKFNDPAIARLNPGVNLPNQDILVVHRSDSSGTTNIFTNYLSSVSSEWKEKVGAGKEVEWPTGQGGEGNDGVTAVIKQNPGGLGYVGLEYAIEQKLSYAKVINGDGKAIEPTVQSIQEAAEGAAAAIPDDLRFYITDVKGDGYPIVGATWILVRSSGYDKAKGDALKAWLKWALESGDSLATELNYAPLGSTLQQRALANVEKINSGT